MTAVDWITVSFFALSAIATVALIGKTRRPITPLDAIVQIILSAGLITYIVVDAL